MLTFNNYDNIHVWGWGSYNTLYKEIDLKSGQPQWSDLYVHVAAAAALERKAGLKFRRKLLWYYYYYYCLVVIVIEKESLHITYCRVSLYNTHPHSHNVMISSQGN